MNVSRAPNQIKPTAPVATLSVLALAAVAVTVCAAASGCAPVVAQATFAYRSDTVEPGDLLGPFDGRVVDAQNGKPVAGAIVQTSWAFESGRGLTAPAGGVTETVATDSDGRYQVSKLDDLPSTRGRIASVTLTVYQRGFVAYRSDRVFDNLRARTDFYQHGNVAKLDRWQGSFSHVEHVRFVGGAGTLKRALGSELVEASLELLAGGPATKAPSGPQAPPLDIGPLLSADELKAVTNFGGKFAVERLTDLETTSSYDSRHFKAVDKAETYDAALRVWRLPRAAAQAQYDKLMSEVPHAEARDEMGDRSLRGYDGRIVAIGALDEAHGLVLQLTCGLDQCRDADQAASLLRRVLARADRLGRAPVAKPTEEAPVETMAPPAKEPASSSSPSAPPASTPPPSSDEDSPFKLKPPELKR